ncbi:hypothetical protein KKB41_02145 [Patescibacteria group bacterium]|nr:hypothetical protein [Patescibacteria group bacterium]
MSIEKMGGYVPPEEKPKTPKEIMEEMEKKGQKPLTQEEYLELQKKQAQKSDRVPMADWQKDKGLKIKKLEEMTPEERKEWEEEQKKMGSRPAVRIE